MPKKILSYSLQILSFIAIYLGIQAWQTRNLLPDNGDTLAPEFSLVAMDEKVYTRSELNAVPTLIYFFAPWCKVCHYSIGNLQALRESRPEQELNILAVVLDWQSREEVAQYIVDHKLTMPVLLGTTQTMEDYRIEAFPTYYVLNADQYINKVSMGYSTELGLRFNVTN